MARGERAHPDAAALETLRAPVRGRVSKAAVVDPVLAAAGPAEAESKEKIGFYVPASEAGRIRAAFAHTRTVGGPRSLSDFIAAHLLDAVRELEREHNGGKPYEPLPPRVIPTGRPLET